MSEDIRLINIKEVCKKTSLSRTAINKFRTAGRFPRSISLGDKRIAFDVREVEQWIQQRIADRDGEAA